MKALLERIDRARYMASRHGLAISISSLGTLFYLLLDPRLLPPPLATLRLTYERFRALLERDLANVRLGHYPRELLFDQEWVGRLFIESATSLELPRVLKRRWLDRWDELPREVDLESFPDYYRRTFHWQTDGWLSDRSARLYEPGVEFVFAGTASVMRRMAIPPIVRADGGRHLDIACGTGRFLGQLARALPRARLYGVDLSPFYAAEARRHLHDVRSASVLTENAEVLPFREAAFDSASCVFLLHELPGQARRSVLREAHRVLRPGGTLVLLDSMQRTDPAARGLEYYLDVFPRFFHEPYYKSYVLDDLPALVKECGFEATETDSPYFSRLVVARKPTF